MAWQVRVAGGMVWKAWFENRKLIATENTTKNPQNGSVLEGKRDPGYFRQSRLVKYYSIWPDHFRFSASHQGWLLSLIANQVYKEDSNQGFNRPACLQILLVVPSLQQGILLNHLLLLGIFPANLTRCLMGESWRGGVEKIHKTLVVLSLSVGQRKACKRNVYSFIGIFLVQPPLSSPLSHTHRHTETYRIRLFSNTNSDMFEFWWGHILSLQMVV